jgi:molecular chaperone GrpE (heat shock protein)
VLNHKLINIVNNNNVNEKDAVVDRRIDPYLLEAHSTLPEANHNQTTITTRGSHPAIQGEEVKSPRTT